ncbi:G-protein beta WD-40 repeats containing protein [Reticulomyxa filosa]|uniref:G-protein beta WD-40 repeats containing protein n=1 Tax=Reticulomyxa filosa TaxID=46433 RepID=X6MMD4_RETFI|nr:G-protein beta WD-40 repeats containing protein [Reticulomyxa filosa]|eukprot:ETO14245.1 G-protein beta WD-40 repeats containing protein [Reticulomyxa filosa]
MKQTTEENLNAEVKTESTLLSFEQSCSKDWILRYYSQEQIPYLTRLTSFQNLKELPIPLVLSQCVLNKNELLICGGWNKRSCYSYHKLKNEYKFICKYPSDVTLNGHCVVKLEDNSNNNYNNEITLLSFGGSQYTKRHTLVMTYVSVWNDNDNEIKSNESNKLNNYNKWIPFTKNHNRSIIFGRKKNYNRPIIIGRKQNHNYEGVRAVIGGRNNHLLFITYQPKNISVYDLNKFQFIDHDILPASNQIWHHCFILNSENIQGQEMIETNEQNYEMLLFCKNTGLSIKYCEYQNTFRFYTLRICNDIAPFHKYAYVCINGVILFFGGYGWNGDKWIFSKSVHKYLIKEDKWMTFQNTLHNPLLNCVAILSDNNIHIIGGNNDKNTTVSTHINAKVYVWDASQLSTNKIKFIIQYWIRVLKIKLGWINEFNKIVINYVKGYQVLMVLQGHDQEVSGVRFSADCRKIVSASCDQTVRIWDVSSGKQLQIFIGHTSDVFTAKFSPDGNTVVSCSSDGTIRLWDVNTGTEIMNLEINYCDIFDVDFSPDGRYIVSGLRDKTIILWDVDSGTEINQLFGHSGRVLSTKFSPDGKTIVSSSYDKTINLWNVESGEILKQFKGHSDIVARARFSPDSKCIVSCSFDNTVQIWDIETGIILKILEHEDIVDDIQYFPDSQTIVSCSRDGTIRLWNVESGKRIQTLNGNSGYMKCVDALVIVKFKSGDYYNHKSNKIIFLKKMIVFQMFPQPYFVKNFVNISFVFIKNVLSLDFFFNLLALCQSPKIDRNDKNQSRNK